MRRLPMFTCLALALAALPAVAKDVPVETLPPQRSKCADGCGMRMKPCIARCNATYPPKDTPPPPEEKGKKPTPYKPTPGDDCIKACTEQSAACFAACK